jgi:hypothetical protein
VSRHKTITHKNCLFQLLFKVSIDGIGVCVVAGIVAGFPVTTSNKPIDGIGTRVGEGVIAGFPVTAPNKRTTVTWTSSGGVKSSRRIVAFRLRLRGGRQ